MELNRFIISKADFKALSHYVPEMSIKDEAWSCCCCGKASMFMIFLCLCSDHSNYSKALLYFSVIEFYNDYVALPIWKSGSSIPVKRCCYKPTISPITKIIWEKILKDGPSKICLRQPSKNLTGYGLFKQTITLQIFQRLSSQILLGPSFNTLSHVQGYSS